MLYMEKSFGHVSAYENSFILIMFFLKECIEKKGIVHADKKRGDLEKSCIKKIYAADSGRTDKKRKE